MAAETDVSVYRAQFMCDFTERTLEYLQCREVAPVEDGELAGTLNWEFSKSFGRHIAGREGLRVAMLMPLACPVFEVMLRKFTEAMDFFGGA